MADKTFSAGSLLIKEMLPKDAQKHYDVTQVLDKGGVKDLMATIINHGGDDSHTAISNVSNLFFNTATENGFSTPLDDYDNDSDDRQALLKEFETKVNAIVDGKGTKLDKAKQLNAVSADITGRLKDQNLNYLLGKNSTAAKMALTGARGNPTQLQQGTASPLMAVDVKGLPIPVAIKSSFAEGLTPAEHLAMSYGGRSSTVKTQLSTARPGEVFKKLTPNLFHEVVTIPDCRTSNGSWIDVNDRRAIVGRYEAGTNRFIDEQGYRELLQSKDDKIKMRSTLTCEAKDGVCQKCYGVASHGKLPKIGENVGVVAAQSASEVLTQAVLSTKHSGGVAGKARSAFDIADNLMRNPTKFQDKATIALVNGTVQRIEKTSLNDHKVWIDEKEHFVPHEQDVTVKLGQRIKQGEPISTGMVNPRELVGLRGLGAGRMQLAKSLRGVYEDDGHKLDPRHFDLVARNLVKWVEVKDPGSTGFMPGQVVAVNDIEPTLKKDMIKLPVAQARGKTLSRQALELTPGTVLDANHIEDLKMGGVKEVYVSNAGLSIEPLVPGLASAKLKDSNWISRLSFTHIRDSIAQAGALGERSKIHSTDPVTSYVLGTEFGEGGGGKY